MSRNRLRQFDLSEIVEGCRQESDRFRAGQPGEEGHCFELFRRAIEEGDQEAWSAVYAQYHRMVARWIGGHQAGDEWKVDDASTAGLMERFYQRLAAGQVVSTALRATQLEVLRRSRHPLYWAGFVLIERADSDQ